MLVYFVLLIMIFFYGFFLYRFPKSKKIKIAFLVLVLGTCTLILGLRNDSVGEDTKHYIDVFEKSQYVSLSDIVSSTNFRTGYYTNEYGYTDTIENGFLLWCKFVHLFTNSGQVFTFLNAAISCFLFGKFIYDNAQKVFLPTLVFVCESMFMNLFNGQRQLMAVAIGLQAYTLLKKRRIKEAVIVLLFATFIHNIIIVMFVLVPIMMINMKSEKTFFRWAIALPVLSPLFIYLGQKIIISLFPRYTLYFSINYWQNTLGKSAILIMLELSGILVMYTYGFKVKYSSKIAVFVLLFICFELMGLRIAAIGRVGLCFRPFLMLYYNQILLYVRKRYRLLVEIAIITLLILFYYSYASNPVRLYSFFWE